MFKIERKKKPFFNDIVNPEYMEEELYIGTDVILRKSSIVILYKEYILLFELPYQGYTNFFSYGYRSSEPANPTIFSKYRKWTWKRYSLDMDIINGSVA